MMEFNPLISIAKKFYPMYVNDERIKVIYEIDKVYKHNMIFFKNNI